MKPTAFYLKNIAFFEFTHIIETYISNKTLQSSDIAVAYPKRDTHKRGIYVVTNRGALFEKYGGRLSQEEFIALCRQVIDLKMYEVWGYVGLFINRSPDRNA